MEKADTLGKRIELQINALADLRLLSAGDPKAAKSLETETAALLALLASACEAKLTTRISVTGKNLCSFCKKQCKTISLPCMHAICKECMVGVMSKASGGTFGESCLRIKCEKCAVPISRKNIFSLVPPDELYRLNVEGTTAKPFSCDICLMEGPAKDFVTLECDHRFHPECLKAHLETNIKEAKVQNDQLLCIKEGCKVPIDEAIIHAVISAEMYDRLSKFRIRQIDWGKQEAFKYCAKCEAGLLIPINAEEFLCPSEGCEMHTVAVCPNCNSKPAHKGKTCEQHRKETADAEDEAKFNEMVRAMKMQKCPRCGIATEKVSGCMFMTCTTPACKKADVHYCYICGKQITQAQHFSHFRRLGPFGVSCNTTDGVPD